MIKRQRQDLFAFNHSLKSKKRSSLYQKTLARYKPNRYHKPELHENVEPNPMPDPLKPFEKKHYYQEYTTKEVPREPYQPPTFPPVPDVQPLPKYFLLSAYFSVVQFLPKKMFLL